ncbi:unnamed protein product [Pseudo-nitzschia multistriata]|uniref:SAC3/GANP/THP3 conserved domain-containing protein n=1 Tax=Pseudo-nitzschia multistriata TaxID=183589 RepID=A0A448ZGD7_9STRA|nr:unnamed protein product [Pseudo-nitzschia multistriata]
MSGFGSGGGGFGNPPNRGGNPFGGGFGGSSGAPGGFGAPAPAPFGSGGFGGSGPQQNQNKGPPPPFGSAPASSSPFGGTNQGGGGGGLTFGSSPNVLVAPSNGGGTNSSSGFGSSNVGRFGGSRSGFGSQPQSQQQQHQQQHQQHANPFGGSRPQSSAPFGGGSQQPSRPPPAPFGAAQASGSPVTFGSSSSVLIGDAGGSKGGSSWGGSGAGAPFSGFSNKSNGKGAGGTGTFGSGPGRTPPSSSNPFGGGSSASSSAPSFGKRSGGFGAALSTGASSEENTGGSGGTNETGGDAPAVRRVSINTAQAEMEEKKRKLQAKIEEKKRHLAERQKQKKEAERKAKQAAPSIAPSKPAQGTNRQDQQQQQQQQQHKQKQPQGSQQSLAERNAQRFAKFNNQSSARSQSPALAAKTRASSGREDLEHAVNLVGLCQTMCPADELRRRENESDIQALEVPLPGKLHPPNWTLEDTAIKRFRRSAADYKLDVPEWVRPPEVLERTMGYLEEWIMERDRQGPDPRFPVKDAPPPPLDVYQFIWDRTRMIRKDFILQNYVGTGGRCDAKAVRCHERIARWHAMCEHQLSHIDDFVTMQSQQNMQELGQTLKTLNAFYDDSLNRSTKEVPHNDTGRETFVPNTNHTVGAGRDDNRSSTGGCFCDTVQGQNPVDYNGVPLNNAGDNPMIARRIIGENNNQTTTRGTAEPEMRGMYMLLILENEGGMEVLKYAARLFKERPAVYHSPPVQLALTIFKAWKDMNYARFFSILRSSSTPYLFSCIMFKQVEVMRRIALCIMSRSYGQVKSTGETLQDQYPLKRLAHVLCFEDMEEAKQTCEFYNITVGKYTSQRTGQTEYCVCWKGSKFEVPKDPEKGHTLRLKPRKMARTIERKLSGSTRLGVCRGDVSGKGATLAETPAQSQLDPIAPTYVAPSAIPQAPAVDPGEEAKQQELVMKQKLERDKLLKEARKKEERDRRAKEELRMKEEKRQLEEQRKKELEERKRTALEERRREEQLRKEEAERKRREQENELQRQKEEALARMIAAEETRARAEEEARKRKELEEKERKEDEERRRLELELRLAEEKRRKQLEEQEMIRRQEEERRREALRLQREEKRKREAEEQRKANEWQARINDATEILAWHRWKRALARTLESLIGSRRSLRAIDPLFKTDNFHLEDLARLAVPNRGSKFEEPISAQPTSKGIIEDSIREKRAEQDSKLAIADMVLLELESVTGDAKPLFRSRESTLLLKVAVIYPETTDVADQSYAGLLHHWISSRVDFGKILTSNRKKSGTSNFTSSDEVRIVIVKGSSYDICATADIALFVIPPHWSGPEQKGEILGELASSLIDDDIPRVALVLRDSVGADEIREINNLIATQLAGNMDAIPIIHPSELSVKAFESALECSFSRIAKLFVHEACVRVSRIPAMQLATKTILAVLWQSIPSVAGEDIDEDAIVECSRLTVHTLIEELAKQFERNETEWSLWPAPEFSSRDGVVQSYFSGAVGLPLEWGRCLDRRVLHQTYESLLSAFRGHFRDAYQRIVVDAPITVQDQCASECAQGQYRRCLERALQWMQTSSSFSGCFLYLPEGLLEFVKKKVGEKVGASPLLSKSKGSNSTKAEIPHLAAEDRLFCDDVPTKNTSKRSRAAPDFFGKRSAPTNGNHPSLKKQKQEDPPVAAGEGPPCVTPVGTVGSQARNPVQTPSTKRRTSALRKGDAYATKLERLLHGDDTIDFVVGQTSSLSEFLRGAPKPKV